MTDYKQIYSKSVEQLKVLKNFPDIRNKPEVVKAIERLEVMLQALVEKYDYDFNNFKLQNLLLNIQDIIKGKVTSLLTHKDYNPQNLNENTIPSINILDKIDKLTNHMREKGYKIDPTPSITLVDDDVENAEEFLGKTAYYDPIDKSIVLYTYGRHPKDIVRSFAHEMIHHMQNLKGEIGTGDIKTTNTNEDDYLEKIEREAYEEGNIAFRNWTDGLKEDVGDDLKENVNEDRVKFIKYLQNLIK